MPEPDTPIVGSLPAALDQPAISDQPAGPVLEIPLDDETLAEWKSRLKESQAILERYTPKWKDNILAFTSQALPSEVKQDTVYVNRDFGNVKVKQAQLFFQIPEVQLKARLPGLEDAVSVYQAVINHYLREEVKADVVMDECLFDLLCPAGLAVSKIGYTNVSEPQMVSMPDPVTGQVTPQQIPRTLYENYFWSRVSPAKFLSPSEFTGSDFDEAAWLSFEFLKPFEEAKRQWNLPDDFVHVTSRDDHVLFDDPTKYTHGLAKKYVKGWEIWYKASLFDANEKNPLQQRQLIILEGGDASQSAVVHRNSPYQQSDPSTGRLIGMEGFPIHVLTITYVSDSAFPPSDCSITRAQINELSKGRTQMIKQRDRNIPMRAYNVNAIPPETTKHIEEGDWQGMLKLEGPAENALFEVARASYPAEDFKFDQVIDDDVMRSWALGTNIAEMPGSSTATQVQTVQNNLNTRLDQERAKVLRFFVNGAKKLGSLIQMFADDQAYIEIIGQDGLPALQAWDKHRIAGKFAFEVKPDSGLRIDAATYRKQILDLYELVARDPYANHAELTKEVFRAHGFDPKRFVIEPSPQGPPPPNVSIRMKGEDLASPVMLNMLNAAGYNLGLPQAGNGEGEAGPVPIHPGAALKAERLTKHRGERTGKLQNAPQIGEKP